MPTLAPMLALVMFAMQAPSTPPVEMGAWILTCDVTAGPGGPPARVFRLAPAVFQEWIPEQRAFGPNLCLGFPCEADHSRLGGTIQSSTFILTVTADPSRRSASWRTAGATGLARTSGQCEMKPDDSAKDARAGSPK